MLIAQRAVLEQTGGQEGVLAIERVEAATELPRGGFGEVEFYPTVIEKAAALGFALTTGHAFADGNKRIGHAIMEVFLMLHNYEIMANIDEQETLFLRIVDGKSSRE